MVTSMTAMNIGSQIPMEMSILIGVGSGVGGTILIGLFVMVVLLIRRKRFAKKERTKQEQWQKYLQLLTVAWLNQDQEASPPEQDTPEYGVTTEYDVQEQPYHDPVWIAMVEVHETEF